ncbi:Nucleoporin-like protein 1 [Elsinoe fawcettii]|nr:Nucleoporin-like protein 1 [Elsinoe fawcettii]
MSLASADTQSARRVSTRNPRRRQRLDSDSVGHQPRRKRSKVTSETFDTPTLTNGSLSGDTLTNGDIETRSRKSATPADSLDIPLRSKKSTQKRAPRNDAGLVMTQNAHYSLRQLSSTPEAVRRCASDFHGSVLSSPSLALVVTREHAYIWDYTSTTIVTQPRTFDVPNPSKASEPAPLGQLIVNGASSSVGLAVVSASSGEVTYWENIETAESLSLFQDRHGGVRGSIGGLFSGETVTAISDAEHAGIILTLSSGRIAQVNLRDAQGKPKIQAQFLRSRDGNNGGLFGSLRGVLGVGWKRDLVGVRTRTQGSKGQMQVISATASAQIQVWDLTWSGQSSYRESYDFKEVLQSKLGQLDTSSSPAKFSQAQVVDFGVLPIVTSGSELSLVSETTSIDLVFLVRKQSAYHLVEVTIDGHKVFIERSTELKGYSAIAPDESPRLLLPQPGHSAVVVFPKAVAVMGLADIDNSGPEAQLLMESHRAPKLFQDVIYFRKESHAVIESASIEDPDERTKQSNCMLFIKGSGVARLAVTDSSASSEVKIPVKSRIEQAIYYGAQGHSVIDFQHVDRNAYSQEEVEEAALQVSEELLASASPFLSTSFATVPEQIGARQRLALTLIAYIRRHFGPISRVTCWRLMNDGEKLNAGSALIQGWNDSLKKEEHFQSFVLPVVIKILRTGGKSDGTSKNLSDPDEVRHWFTYGLHQIDQLINQVLSISKSVCSNNKFDNVIKMISECDDIVMTTFKAVFEYRYSHAEAYGINPAAMIDGVLEEGWEDLPEPWTATHELLNGFDQHVDNARNFTVSFYDAHEDSHDEVDDYFVAKVVKGNPELVEILCKCYQERIGWCLAHYSEKHRKYAPGLKDKFGRSRQHHLRGLMKIGQAASGFDVAEKYKDMDSLVTLVMSETAYLNEMREAPDVDSGERKIIINRMDGLTKKIKGFFRDHGDDFANRYFDAHLAGQHSYGLLIDQSEGAMFKEPLTKYLRAEGSRGKLGWINEVLNTGDLSQAQSALHSLAREHERKIWNKKVELSLAKLTAMASVEGGSQPASDVVVESIDHDLNLIKIQEAIYAHLSPIVATAVDHEAEVQLVSDAYSVNIREPYPNLFQLLERNFDNLLNHIALSVEEVIDVLTLMDSVPSADPEADIAGEEFLLAFRALNTARPSLSQERFQTLLHLIWKRCYLQDDWDLIGKTKGRSDEKIVQRVRETNTCSTIALGLANVFSVDSPVTILKPDECIGAGSTSEDLMSQFPQADIRQPIVEDNASQDKALQLLIDKHQLSRWVDTAITEAKKLVDEEAEYRLQEQQSSHQGLEADINGDGLLLSDGALNGDVLENGLDDSLDELEEEVPEVEEQQKDEEQVAAVETVEVKKGRKTKVNGTNGIKEKAKDVGKENEGFPGARKIEADGKEWDRIKESHRHAAIKRRNFMLDITEDPFKVEDFVPVAMDSVFQKELGQLNQHNQDETDTSDFAKDSSEPPDATTVVHWPDCTPLIEASIVGIPPASLESSLAERARTEPIAADASLTTVERTAEDEINNPAVAILSPQPIKPSAICTIFQPENLDFKDPGPSQPQPLPPPSPKKPRVRRPRRRRHKSLDMSQPKNIIAAKWHEKVASNSEASRDRDEQRSRPDKGRASEASKEKHVFREGDLIALGPESPAKAPAEGNSFRAAKKTCLSPMPSFVKF